uniref:Uncharacterized protein n=1 Tax=Panagrolaimus sp. ES5 TaxID=591445 RepID=A0AC34GJ68_9BILA
YQFTPNFYVRPNLNSSIFQCYFKYDNRLLNSEYSFTKSSTLSQHIAAYEAAIGQNDLILPIQLKSLGKSVKDFKNVVADKSLQAARDIYEFPRQQENGETTTPEVAQHKTSQNLVNPNLSPSPTGQKRPWISPFAQYIRPPEQRIHNLITQIKQLEATNLELQTQNAEQKSCIEDLSKENENFKTLKEQKDEQRLIIDRLLKENKELKVENEVLQKENLAVK